jgi:tRNA threonylcarbamoyl adenosine modification protein (Sua5/YciO/YrdC/YwlC family)
MAEHLYTFDDPPSQKHLERTCRLLEQDGIIAYQTDLNWAIGCNAASPKAVDRIKQLKPHHPKERPFSLLCSSISMVAEFAVVDNYQYRMLKKAWPGPYTVILESHKSLVRQLKDKRRAVGVRVPDSPMLIALLELYGKPIVTTSLPDIDDLMPVHFGYEVMDKFGFGIDLILDLGNEVPGARSTIVDMTSGQIELIRSGAGDVSLFE